MSQADITLNFLGSHCFQPRLSATYTCINGYFNFLLHHTRASLSIWRPSVISSFAAKCRVNNYQPVRFKLSMCPTDWNPFVVASSWTTSCSGSEQHISTILGTRDCLGSSSSWPASVSTEQQLSVVALPSRFVVAFIICLLLSARQILDGPFLLTGDGHSIRYLSWPCAGSVSSGASFRRPDKISILWQDFHTWIDGHAHAWQFWNNMEDPWRSDKPYDLYLWSVNQPFTKTITVLRVRLLAWVSHTEYIFTYEEQSPVWLNTFTREGKEQRWIEQLERLM